MIHKVFYILLLEQDITKKRQIDKNATELDAGNDSKKYKIEAIYKSAIYARKSAGHLLELYHLVF